MVRITFGKIRDRQRPDDGQPGVPHIERAFGYLGIRCCAQIDQFTTVGQCLKCMSKTFWNNQAPVIIGGKYLAMPVQKCGRTVSQVDRHIEYLTLHAAHDFVFSKGWILKMQAAHGTGLESETLVDLRNGLFEPCILEFFRAVETREEATVVFYCLALYQRQATYWCANKIKAGHEKYSGVLIQRLVIGNLSQSNCARV